METFTVKNISSGNSFFISGAFEAPEIFETSFTVDKQKQIFAVQILLCGSS